MRAVEGFGKELVYYVFARPWEEFCELYIDTSTQATALLHFTFLARPCSMIYRRTFVCRLAHPRLEVIIVPFRTTVSASPAVHVTENVFVPDPTHRQ